MTSFLLRIMTEVKKCFIEIIIDELKIGDLGFKKHCVGCFCHLRSRPASQTCGLCLQPRLPGRAGPPARVTLGSLVQNSVSYWEESRAGLGVSVSPIDAPTEKENIAFNRTLLLPTGVPSVLFCPTRLEGVPSKSNDGKNTQ